MSYDVDPQTGLRTRAGTAPDYNYSDGDAVEQRIAQVVVGAEDLRVGSPELAAHITDWPSSYHLSQRRADALRPVEHLLRGRVLEVGAGCGAITRYLGEVAASVVAVEGSARRAAIAASRVRDLERVAVHVDTLAALDVPGGFDAVTLIGVLEYSRLYSTGPDPVGELLARCRELLAPSGVLVVAIENQLGLKYLAGAPEDHLGRPFIGVEDGYRDDGPVTFGRRELERRLREAGFPAVDFLYPLPDYKHARAVLTEAGLEQAPAVVVDVLRGSGAPLQGRDYARTFAEEVAWDPVARNGLAADLANSFVAVAGPAPQQLGGPGELLTVFGSERRRAFAKSTSIVATADGLVARRRRLFPDEPAPDLEVEMVLDDEPVLDGTLLVRGLQSLVNVAGWSVVDLVQWAAPWVRLLDAAAVDGHLPTDYVDATPNNVVLGSGGSLHTFDLEWVARQPPARDFVVVRGLLSALSGLRSVAAPAEGTPLQLVELVAAVSSRLSVGDAALAAALQEEAAFQEAVTGRDRALNLASLQTPELTVRSADFGHDAAGARAAIVDLHAQLFQARQRVEQVEAERDQEAAAREREATAREQEAAARQEAQARVVALEEAGGLLAADRDRVLAAERAAREELDMLRASTSWRVSAPLRRLGPMRVALQGPVSQRPSLRDPNSWRALAGSVRRRGVVGTARRVAAGSPVTTPTASDYRQWVQAYDTLSDEDLSAAREHIARLSAHPVVSVVVPVYRPLEEDLRRAVESVVAQVYPHWQLVLVDDASPDQTTRPLLEQLATDDERITVIQLERNAGIAGATNAGLAVADGDFVAFLDHDDELAPHALLLVADALADQPELDVVYSDEDKIDATSRRYEPYFKPDYNRELLLAQNYFNHLTVVRRELIERVGGLRPGFEGAQDHDLVLRVVAATSPDRIRHVPHVLYHWRQYPGMSSFSRDQLERAAASGRRAVREHLADDPTTAAVTVEPHPRVPNWHRVAWTVPSPSPAVTVVIPTRDRVELLRDCVEGLLEGTDYDALEVIVVDNDSTDPATLDYLTALRERPRARVLRAPGPFNFSALNNAAVQQVASPLVLLLNNDIVVREPDWLARMVGLLEQPDVGAVGARLLYGDGTVQHAGVVLGVGGVAGHAQKHAAGSDTGYFGRLVLTQEVSAVTGACLLTRTELYRQVGGLDADQLRIAFNDVDFCLKIRRAGYRILWSAEAELFHLESVSRGAETTPEKVKRFNAEIDGMVQRWGSVLREDPTYNPNLTLDHEDYSLAFPPRRAWPWRSASA